MKLFLSSLPYILMMAWLAFSLVYVYRARRNFAGTNKYIFDSIPQVFPTIGILGTFIGIAYGLWYFDVYNIESSIPELLNGLKTAFLASIGGIVLLIVFSNITAIVQKRGEEGTLSDEAIAMYKLVEAVNEMKTEQQASLQLLRTEFVKLAGDLKNINTEMTQAVVKELYEALEQLIDEFKHTMSSAREEMEVLTREMHHAGDALNEVTPRLQQIALKINEGFDAIQELVKKLEPSTDVLERMEAQIAEVYGISQALFKRDAGGGAYAQNFAVLEHRVSSILNMLQTGLCKYPRL